MIEVLTANTPNGKKITIMLEEIGFKYKNRKYIFKTKLIGKIQIKNLIMAILAAHNSNISLKKIVKLLQSNQH